ncbi:M23 family metallopeptidase [Pedobacter sp. SYSU D00535]|uniref:M23 family metallopeptidase n=1 Tax=Pedobacter sp. SYSU D00535 TaxID=2810308 RepID=UPI001A976177|nr:M23 family metallopeptidase [Pedobacter sp. SYSU D00535]
MRSYWILRLNKINTSALLFILLTLSGTVTIAQDILVSKAYPNDFRPPLDLAPSLAGSFGEIRGNHFHSGLDYRTNQREGYPVYAVADGFVSRLRVQAGGFGYAVYITHPNGYTSVYAHLQRFNDRIFQTVNDYQYRKQSFEVDFPLLPIEIPVKKGDIIAWSGNSGSSGGPHLHFELRDTRTEETINPQLFGLEVPDRVKPILTGMYMYRLGGAPFSEKTPSQYFQLVGGDGNYHLNQSPVIQFDGEVGFGIMTYDQQVPGGNKNGVYSIELYLDNEVIYASAQEKFAFHNTRAINSHIDYPAYILYKRTVQKSFIEPGNPLQIYKKAVNRGIVALRDDSIHQMRYVIKDARGNTSTLSFRVKRNPASFIQAEAPTGQQKFTFGSDNNFSTDLVKISVPKGTLYSDITFQYAKKNRRAGYSSVHDVHNRLTPLHTNYDLWIKPETGLPQHLLGKALIVDTRGISQGGSFDEKDGFVKASPRSFGSFYVTVDTVPPSIRPVNISDAKSMKGLASIVFKISDNLSGIRSYSATIDGQWVLMEFDAKTATLKHSFDYRTSSGKHLFQLIVTDMKMNSRTYTASFYK